MISLFAVEASVPGPHLLFLGGVHGDETPGVLALGMLIDWFQAGKIRLLRGKVTIAARVNANAVKAGKHYLEENLNRIVYRHASPATHEQNLANELIALIDGADAVLDLHGTPAPTRPFVFLDDESALNRAWAESLGTDYLLCGWPALYPGGKTVTTTEYAHGLGKRALTIEVGQNDDHASAERGLTYALRSLSHFGLTALSAAPKPPRPLRFIRVVYREREGSFVHDWKNFDAVEKGEVLSRYSDGVEFTAPEDGYVVMPYASAPFGEEWFYLAVAG